MLAAVVRSHQIVGRYGRIRCFCEGRSWQQHSSLSKSFDGSLVGFDVHGAESIRGDRINRPLFRRGGLEKRFKNGREAAMLISKEIFRRDPAHPLFVQAAQSVLHDLAPVFDRSPQYAWAAKHMLEPEKLVSFRVPWVDDIGVPRINRGWRIQFSSSLGPFTGGTTFNEKVNTDSLKSGAFDQIIQSSLTGLPIGGARGGSDFHPAGKSNAEIRSFCRSYMVGLAPYIGLQRDVPTGDIGCGEREIGYMYGRYKRMTGESNAAMGGKVIGWGTNSYDTSSGSDAAPQLTRENATGRGVVRLAALALQDRGESLEGKRCLISGSGNIALEVSRCLMDCGAIPISLSDDAGFVLEPDGFTPELREKVKQAKAVNPKNSYGRRMSEYIKISSSARFFPNSSSAEVRSLWQEPCDLAFACDRSSPISARHARALVDNGCVGVFEGILDRPTAHDAIDILHRGDCIFLPGKTGSIGGLALTGLMVTQLGAQNISYDIETEFDKILSHAFTRCKTAAEEYGMPWNLSAGGNISAFIKVADAMFEQGAV